MLDHDALKTPPGDGDVLVLPAPRECSRLLRENQAALRSAETIVAGRPLREWRREARARLVGDSDRPTIVLGHQPEFIHPGVWAKHVIARRLAQAVDGVALNLIVDNDAPRSTTLAVPCVQDGRVILKQVPVLSGSGRRIYEELAPLPPEHCTAISENVREAMGDRFDASLMPIFLDKLSKAPSERSVVPQLVTARQAVEQELGIRPNERRVSEIDWSPLLLEMVRDAARFADCYNEALAAYRVQRRIRGTERPMPDLRTGAAGIELPIWAVRRGEARRRVFAVCDARRATLRADDETIGGFDLDDLDGWIALTTPLDESGGWRLRPRALTLTLWARLFLADIFVHGIGGAKYDGICDELIQRYFHRTPPAYMCVSATLRLDLPGYVPPPQSLAAATHQLRDWRWNPQRHVVASHLASLIQGRHTAVAAAETLRMRRAPRTERRRAFEAIRRASDALLDQSRDEFRSVGSAVESAHRHALEARIAAGREYFFALYSRPALRRLMDALPDIAAFRL